MPCSKAGKTSINQVDLQDTVNEELANNMSLCEVARLQYMSRSTLGRHIELQRVSGNPTFTYSATNAVNQVFTEESESSIHSKNLSGSPKNKNT
ncbi:hypothetical protein HHI36_008068 [Cryptolaemus montrouzieri]|uniref:HTH psq-type domain-containing protein n=1 Tax=Cryptolaemus montrouzieri TaxID=559131 RepID=A0ABD2MRP2_9CUCU